MTTSDDGLRQRADYTYTYNAKKRRHGWLRLTPAYSAKVVEEIIERYKDAMNILDPFCGTGTTALSAINLGHVATTTDINPFLVWLARSKTARYSEVALVETWEIAKEAVDLTRREMVSPVNEPALHNIERWWTVEARNFLCHLKAAIQMLAGQNNPVSDLLNIAFCRMVVRLSNASFGHQSMSFKSKTQYRFALGLGGETSFLDELDFVLKGAVEEPTGDASVILGDARDLPNCLDTGFDVVVTSPPYANRMSYIRELRPYMYWLGYLENGRSAGELDWLTIGGTWGIATSRLTGWEKSDCWLLPPDLSSVIDAIAHANNKNGALLANYIAKYCEDMSQHFECLRRVLNPGARVHYIVGNSTFYGVLVSTEQIYAAMMKDYGFSHVDVKPIRKRNSKKELIEFEVSATWPS